MTRKCKLPNGVPLHFVKGLRGLSIVDGYRALNRITQRNNEPVSRPEEMFDCIEDSNVVSKIDLQTGLYQI